MPRSGVLASALVAAVCVGAASADAWAQDYTATSSSGLFEARPEGATQHAIKTNSTIANMSVVVNLPFAFPYYGKTVTTATVSVYGFIMPGATAILPVTTMSNNHYNHGENATSGAFPFTQTGVGGAGPANVDGIIAPFWQDWQLGNGLETTGYVYSWTSGTAPNRRFVVLWENGSTGFGRISPQIQLFEGSGRIVFAYTATGTYLTTTYTCGIDSPIDARYMVAPNATNSSYNAGARTDVVFDPRVVAVTGALHFDKIVSDAGGIGNSVLGDRALAGFPIRLVRTSDGYVYGSGTTASDGAFSFTGYGLPAATPGAIVVSAQNAACNVSATVGGPAVSWTAAGSVSFAADAPLGVVTLGVATDPNGSLRSAFNVALACGAAGDWAASRTAATIPQLSVVFDDASLAVTKHLPAAGINPAALYVGGRSSPSPDAWDDGVVTKTYARHVIASVSAPQTTPVDDRFDAVTDRKNAFAEGFCCWLWAAASGASRLIDGKSSTTADVHDLEHPSVTVAKSDDVAGCVAGMLFDLLDAANEASDPVDGSSAPERVLQLVDASTSALEAKTFLPAWIDAGYEAKELTRIYIGNGLLADDASEPNDSAPEPTPLGPVGVVKHGFALNQFNEDWFSVTLPADVSALQADVKYDQFTTGATIVLEIRDAAGTTTLATGTPVPVTGAVQARTAAVAAGTYFVRVAHASGSAIPIYSVQAYVPPSMDAAPVRDWTVGRDYDLALGVRDGIAPYTLTTPASAMPPGMGLNSSNLHANGRPSTVGSYSVTVQLRDSGDPANVVQRAQTVAIHDVFKLPIAPFVGFPAGKSVDVTLPTHEGTPPFTLTVSSGAPTSGLAFAPNSLHVVGTATAGPSSAFELDGVDVAGSADHVATRAVVAVELAGKKIPAELAAGVDACGWWFDAVAGSTVTFTVATGKGQPKRALTGAFLAPDRSLVATGKVVGRLGGVSASKLVCPQSGRHYFIASTTDAGPATQLLGTATVALPKAGKGLNKTFAPNATTTVEFGAVPGSTATVKFAGDKKATLVARVVSITSPNGVQISPATLVKPTPTGGTLTLPLPVGGTWKVVLGATSTNGTPGKLTYSYALKQLRGAVYAAE